MSYRELPAHKELQTYRSVFSRKSRKQQSKPRQIEPTLLGFFQKTYAYLCVSRNTFLTRPHGLLAQRFISQSRKVGKDIENESGTESRSPVKDPVRPIKRWLYHVCSSACEQILSGIRLLLRGFDNIRRN